MRMTVAVAMVVGAGWLAAAPTPAVAQTNICGQLQTLLKERQTLMQRINGMGRRNVDPAVACRMFGQLASNGQRTLAFATENKDWCQVPDEFINNLKSAQGQVSGVRGQACRAASQRAQLERRARQAQQAQQQNQGSFGGVDGFSGGPWRVPQGAL